MRPAWPGQLLLVSGVVTRISLWRFSSVQCWDNVCRLHAQICDMTLKTDVNWSSISCLFILKIIKSVLTTRSYWRESSPSDLSAYDPSQLGRYWELGRFTTFREDAFENFSKCLVSGCFCKVVWMLTCTTKFLWAAQTKKGTAYMLMKLHASLFNCMQAHGSAICNLHASSWICMYSGTFWKILEQADFGAQYFRVLGF